MDEQGAHGKSQTQTQKKNLQKAEAWPGNLGGILRHCLYTKRQSSESQSLTEIESGEGLNGNSHGFSKFNQGKCGPAAEGDRGPVTQDMAKADIPIAFFAQSLTVRLALRNPRTWRQALFILQFAAKKRLQVREEEDLWLLAEVLAFEYALEKTWFSAAQLEVQGRNFRFRHFFAGSHHFPPKLKKENCDLQYMAFVAQPNPYRICVTNEKYNVSLKVVPLPNFKD